MFSSVALDCFAAFVVLTVIAATAGGRVRAGKMHWASTPLIMIATLPGFVQFFRAVLAPKAATIAAAEHAYHAARHGTWHVFLGLAFVLPITAVLDARARRAAREVDAIPPETARIDMTPPWAAGLGVSTLIIWYFGVALLAVPTGAFWVKPAGFGFLTSATLNVIGFGLCSVRCRRRWPTGGR